MKTVVNYLKYSGLWAGFVLNPYHWRWGFVDETNIFNEPGKLFDSSFHLGFVWIRIIIDNGDW